MKTQIKRQCLVWSLGVLVALGRVEAAVLVANSSGVDPSFPAGNTVDGSQATFANMNTSGSYITYDLGSAQLLSSIAFSSRNSGFFATDAATFPGSVSGFPAAVQVSASDNPVGADWSTVAASAFTLNVSSASGRLLLGTPVTKRYFRFLETPATTHSAQFAELRANPRVVISGSSSAGLNDPSFPMAQGADGNLATFANVLSTTGSLTLDLGEFGLGGMEGLKIVARADSANFMPSNIVLRVSSTDNPASFDTIVATTNLFLASVSAGGTNTIPFAALSKRYLQMSWIGNVSGSGGSIQFAELDIVTVPEPSTALLFVVGGGLLFMGRRRPC